jgi:hypothetical protein
MEQIKYEEAIMKLSAINSRKRSKILFTRNCYNSKRLFEEFAVGAENLVSHKHKAFTPKIIQFKKYECIKIG